MAFIQKTKDLVTTMNATESRLKKVERQLAVPRKGSSSIVTELSHATGAMTTFSNERVTVVTTANCLIYFFMQVDARMSGSNAYISINDVETGASFRCFNVTLGAGNYKRYSTAPGPLQGGSTNTSYNFVRSDTAAENYLRGGAVIIPSPLDGWAHSAGSHQFTIGYQTDGLGGTLDFQNRKLYAWVQPF